MNEKFLPLETFQRSNALISCKDVQEVNIHEKSSQSETSRFVKSISDVRFVQLQNHSFIQFDFT